MKRKKDHILIKKHKQSAILLHIVRKRSNYTNEAQHINKYTGSDSIIFYVIVCNRLLIYNNWFHKIKGK